MDGERDAMRLAEKLARCSADVLQDALLAVIVHGSLVLGDYVPGRSDIDLLAVVDEPLGDAQVASFTAALGKELRRAPTRVDLRVVTRATAEAPTPAPPLELHLEGIPAEAVRVTAPQPSERDLVVEFSVCRAHGRSLVGAAPSEVLGEVPDDWVVGIDEAVLAEWEAPEDWPASPDFTVLTVCRMWRFAEERIHCSKAAAGEWALTKEPGLEVVRDALHRRHVDASFHISEAAVQELIALVRGRLAHIR